jgi:nucleobase:cation symporter-1, NCS1 family
MRTWGPWTFIGYWFSDMVTVATWQFGSSVLLAGLSTSDAFLVMFFSSVCNVIPTGKTF